MRVLSMAKKCLRQQLRDRLALSLTLLTAPFFVLLYWMFFSGQSAGYKIFILDNNAAEISLVRQQRQEIANVLKELSSSSGRRFFEVTIVDERSVLEKAVLDGEATAGIILPRSFPDVSNSRQIKPVSITVVGDATLAAYHIATVLIQRAFDRYFQQMTGFFPLIRIVERPLGLSSARTPFEVYVPGLLVFAVIMLIFSSSMSIAREVESGTLERLKMTRMNTFDIMAGISAVQLILGMISVMITFLTARALGFQSAGSIILALSLAMFASLASVGIGMMVASLSRNMTLAFLISSVAMFLLILFSGIIFPRPEVTLFYLYNHPVGLFDILPTTHMGIGLGKVLTLGASLSDVAYEMTALFILSLVYFGIGVFIFNKTSNSFIN